MARNPKPWYWKARKCWFVTIDGQRHNLGEDKKEAEKRFHELMLGKPKVKSDSVLCLFDEFLEWTQKHRAERTYGWYKDFILSFAKEVKHLSTDQVKPYHVQKWVDSQPGWDQGTRRGAITAIKRAFNWAVKQGYIDRSPIRHLEKPEARRREIVVTEEEYRKILEVSDQCFGEMVTFALETGARPNEIIIMEDRHLDLKNDRVVLPTDEAKGKKRIRTIYLTPRAKEILIGKTGRIFRNSEGNPWTAYAINCRFGKLKKKIGRRLCLYAFRHTFAQRKLEAGVDCLVVATLMGHSDVSMLAKYYQHHAQNPEYLLNQLKRA